MGGFQFLGREAAQETETHPLACCVEAFFRHARSIQPHTHPAFYRTVHASPEELWMRSPEDLLADELTIYHEEFPLIRADLLCLPADPPILADGAALLPELAAPLLQSARQAIWMIPTPDFQREHYARREWACDVVKDCSNPDQAFHNWMERDIRFASQVQHQADRLGLRVLVVDGSQSIAENTVLVQAHFDIK